MDVEQQIRRFLLQGRRWRRPEEELTADYPLIENEVLDSMGIFELVSFLEDRIGIEVHDDDLIPDNFASISAIADLVNRRSAE